jgi:hypothetical protein
MKDVEDLIKQDRLEIYRKAREIYKEEINFWPANDLPGMCWCIVKAASNLGLIYDPPKTLELINSVYSPRLREKYWPEFDALNTKNQGGYWWPRGDTESRLKAFDELCKI